MSEIAYLSHLEEKTTGLHSGLASIGCEEFSPEIVATPLDAGYRNRVKIKIFHGSSPIRFVGMDPLEGETAVENMLWILPPWARKTILNLKDILTIRAENFPVDGAELQLCHGREEAHLSLSVKKKQIQPYDELLEAIFERGPEITGIAVPSQRLMGGDPFLNHRLLGENFIAHYAAFFQANLCLTPRLIENVREAVQLHPFDRIVDVYCGTGLFSLYCGEAELPVTGVDVNPFAIESAERNAALRGFMNSSFHFGSAEGFVREFPLEGNDLVFLNPPRSGCSSEVLDPVIEGRPGLICLISCFPETQLRDLRLLLDVGYKLLSLSAFDMFPFSDYLETIALLV
ncbi:MAG: methyltransferase domain-containing protein [Candidatus Aminicenantes bacterium]|nr:methyltransferase domain-containing protein [Candidatus Aminicenantes bacterium]